MPVIIRDCDNDEATVIMVDANIQREDILISEKAKAYRMKYEAMKHQGSAGGLSLKEMSDQAGDSMKTIQRLICIANLDENLLALVDAKKLGIRQGVDLSFLEKNQQEVAGHAQLCVYDYLIRVPFVVSAPGVRAASGIANAFIAASGLNASSALPTPVQYAGNRPPTREATLIGRWPRMRSRYTTSVPSSTARCTVSWLASKYPSGLSAVGLTEISPFDLNELSGLEVAA